MKHQSGEWQSQHSNANRYVAAFEDWMEHWQPDVFVTINLPNAPCLRRQIRSHEFYLALWTRIAEQSLTSLRYVVHGNRKERIVWIFRREVSPDSLIHYHALAKIPDTVKRIVSSEWDATGFCESLQQTLKIASSRTPEPVKRRNEHLPICADIDVRPATFSHYGYLMKDMIWPTTYNADKVDSVILRDSGLTILPSTRLNATAASSMHERLYETPLCP